MTLWRGGASYSGDASSSETHTSSVSFRVKTRFPVKAGCAQVEPMILVRDCS